MSHADEYPLENATSGAPVIVTRLDGGEGFRSKVISMGIVPGKEVVVRSYSRSGPVVVQIDGGRFAIGRGMAKRILVKSAPVNSCEQKKAIPSGMAFCVAHVAIDVLRKRRP